MSDNAEETLVALLKNADNIPGVSDCSKSKMYRRQWITSINFVLIVMGLGMAQGHTAILLQQLDPAHVNATQKIKIETGEIFGKSQILVDSVDMQSWIASIMVLFMCPGCWILAISSKRVGRKPILFVSGVFLFISWLIIAFANNEYQIMIGRSLSGLCIGLLGGLVSVYQGECIIPKLRAILNAMLSISFCTGVLLCHAVGTWFHWRTTALFCSLVQVIALFINYLMPESPVWLLKQNRLNEAIYSWTFLRGIRDLDELKSMHVENSRKSNPEKTGSDVKTNKFCVPEFLKPLSILLVLFTVLQLSGMGAVTFYCIQIISDIAGKENAYIPTLILDIFRLIFAIVLTISSRKLSTRTLTIYSAFICSIFLMLSSGSIIFKIWAPWFPLILLFCYEAAITMGLAPLPWSFCSELFPIAQKEIAIGIVTSYNHLLFFVIVKINPHLLILLKLWGTFLFYGFITFIGSFALYYILPNTKNKSLKEIESMFSNSKK